MFARRGWFALLALTLAVSPVVAEPQKAQGQASAVGQIGLAIANANLCGFEVNTPRVAAVIRDRVAPAGKLTPEIASEMLAWVVTAEATQTKMLGVNKMSKLELVNHCSDIIGLFGPEGTKIPGLLKF